MSSFKKLNRGAIIFAVLLLCVIVGVSAVASSRNRKLDNAENTITEFLEDAAKLYIEYKDSRKIEITAEPADKGEVYIEGYKDFFAFSQEKLSKYFVDGKVSADLVKYLYSQGYLENWNYTTELSAEEDSVEFYKDGGISFYYFIEQKRYEPEYGAYALNYGRIVVVLEKTDNGYIIVNAGSTEGADIPEYSY